MKQYERLELNLETKKGLLMALDLCPKMKGAKITNCRDRFCNECVVDFLFSEVPETKEPEYRPYESVLQMIDDFDNRFPSDRPVFSLPFIWVKSQSKGIFYLVNAFSDDSVWIGCSNIKLDVLFNFYTYLDGTPVGKLVEE